MPWETTLLYKTFLGHWIALPKGLLVFTVCLQIQTSEINAVMNQTYIGMYVEPSPSLRTISTGAIQGVTETTVLRLYNNISNSAPRTNFVIPVGLISKTRRTLIHNGSRIVEYTNKKTETDHSSTSQEDKSVVFYRKVGSVNVVLYSLCIALA